ncbi:ABC transporter substrate-binding protein [Fusobacterium necrophorum subsp. funduliforme]
MVGSKIKIAVSNSQLRSQMAEIIQAQLKEIGLEVSIENLEWGTFLSATANGEVDMFILGWGPSTYDGDYGLFPNFHSSQKGGSGNRSQYANPKMDQLLEEGRKEMDVEKRRDLYKQAADLINEEAVVLPLYYPLTSVGYRKAIKGVKAESYPMIHKYSY